MGEVVIQGRDSFVGGGAYGEDPGWGVRPSYDEKDETEGGGEILSSWRW